MDYSTGSHTLFHHRHHIVWAPEYRYKVLHGEVRTRLRDIIRQVCAEMGVTIVSGVLSRDHVHMFVEIRPHIRVCDFVRKAKGRSSRKIQQEFEHIRKRYWGQRFRARGYLSTTSGNITDNVILNYLDKHTAPSKPGFSPAPRTCQRQPVSHSVIVGDLCMERDDFYAGIDVPVTVIRHRNSAMAAGVTDRLWEIADIAMLVEAAETKPGKRGVYRKMKP